MHKKTHIYKKKITFYSFWFYPPEIVFVCGWNYFWKASSTIQLETLKKASLHER